jgi:hypothetical protein
MHAATPPPLSGVHGDHGGTVTHGGALATKAYASPRSTFENIQIKHLQYTCETDEII